MLGFSRILKSLARKKGDAMPMELNCGAFTSLEKKGAREREKDMRFVSLLLLVARPWR